MSISLYRWMNQNRYSRARKNAVDEIVSIAGQIKEDPGTKERRINDYTIIDTYLKEKFPTVDVSDIPIYIVTPETFSKVGFDNFGGCFIASCNAVFVKTEIKSVRNEECELFKELYCFSEGKVSTEDVLVHEMIHAVSETAKRPSRKYRHMEEEFVYTNCIDFYRNKGMTNEEIVVGNFLPFLLQDLISSAEHMSKAIYEATKETIDILSMTKKEYTKILDKNAKKVAPILINLAKSEGYRMIELYNSGEYRLVEQESPKTVSRFAGIDFLT